MNLHSKLTIIALISINLEAVDITAQSVGLNVGTSHFPFSKKDNIGSIILENKPNESFSSIEISTILNPVTKMCKDKNMKPYLSYTYSSNSDMKHQYILAGVNKYYPYKSSSLYAGALLGYGQLDWKYDPLNSSKYINKDSNSFIAGIQTGVDYPIDEKFSLGLNVKYLLHDYETKLEPTTSVSSSIEHKSSFNVSLGLRYSF
ncbi:MAG: hypothetical protein U9Q33_03765 [Campylobacterota bacterium]|nr:hypothetical protein [Campylobacterota bacterium]